MKLESEKAGVILGFIGVSWVSRGTLPVFVPEPHAGIMGVPQWHYSSFEFDEHRRGAQRVKQGKSDHR